MDITGYIERIVDYLPVLWTNIVFWRSFAIALFAVVVLIIMFKNQIIQLSQRERIKAFDSIAFTESDKLMDEEQFTAFLQSLDDNHFYAVQSVKAGKFVSFFGQAGNRYMDKGLRKSCARFAAELKKLLDFLDVNCFAQPTAQNPDDAYKIKMALHPESLKEPQTSKNYQYAKTREKELQSMLKRVTSLYKNYRSTAKKKLAV